MLFNDYKNVKTIIFSELPQQDKVKYFNFLLENEINFSRDETGNYVALVKVLNPAFYGGQDQKPNQAGQQQQQVNQNEKQQKTSDSKQQYDQEADPMILNKSKGSVNKSGSNKLRAEPNSIANKGQNGNNRTGWGGNNNMNNNYNNANRNTNNNYNNKNNNPSFNRLRSAGSHFEKDKKNLGKKNYWEIFNGRYQKFLQCVNPLLGVRGKKMNINAVKYAIEEIYSIRFLNDANVANNQQEDIQPIPFPNFVFEFLSNKFSKKPMVDQHSLDLLLSVDYYSRTDDIINIFSRFLNEEYEVDDLEFYLYVRSCIEKETKGMFIEKARDVMKHQYNEDFEENGFELSVKSCLNVANCIYENEEEQLLKSFMNKIEDVLNQQREEGNKKNLIRAEKILEITLQDYHENKAADNNGEGGDIPTNKINNHENSGSINKELTMKNTGSLGCAHLEDNNNPKNSDTYLHWQQSYLDGNCSNQEEKIARWKAIIGAYIKEKELDVFFSKLLTSYSIYEKGKQNIEETLASIKELVSKKVNLLIKIWFDEDQNAWFQSLKLKEGDQEANQYFGHLLAMLGDMLEFDQLQEISEDLVESFSQALLSTPELNSQINKLVLKRFE